MSVALNNNPSQSEEDARKKQLNAWFVANEIQKKEVAELLGLTPQNLSRILSGNYKDPLVYSKLISLQVKSKNIPLDLLPRPKAKEKTGPKARVA